jgi:uncharacterized membrane protein YdbT with pleckstrin-like domain
MNKLHKGARWLFRLRAYGSFIPLVVFIAAFSIAFMAGEQRFLVPYNLIFIIILAIIISEIYARMSYNRYLYEITPEGIKKESGIIWKKYSSIPYERVQNVDIQRGIIARMFGFSSLQIETAGQSGLGAYYGRGLKRRNRRYESEGYIPAVEMNDAEKIRELIIKKIKQTHRDKEGI